jgi:hypothetical protein
VISDFPPLGLETVDLLLSIAESPRIAISGAALDGFHKTIGTVLVSAGAIKPDGFEAVAVSQADHDDAIVSLVWSSELGGYGYFSPAVGLIRIDDDRLRRYKLDFSWFLRWLVRHLGFDPGAQSMCLIADKLWDLGDIWLGTTKRMRRRTAVYFARRLTEPETITQVAAVLRMHRIRTGKVILTTSKDLALARTIIADTCAILRVDTCARAGIDGFDLDPEIIYSAVYGLSAPRTKLPVQANADFRVIRIGDREFRFLGDKQRQVIGFLYQRWEKGEGPISTALMFEELGWSETKRLRDLFKGHASWRQLLGFEDGACWLRCDEILAETEVGAGALR